MEQNELASAVAAVEEKERERASALALARDKLAQVRAQHGCASAAVAAAAEFPVHAMGLSGIL